MAKPEQDPAGEEQEIEKAETFMDETWAPVAMVLVFISIWLMNRFTGEGDEGVATI